MLDRCRRRLAFYGRLSLERGHRVFLHYGNTPEFYGSSMLRKPTRSVPAKRRSAPVPLDEAALDAHGFVAAEERGMRARSSGLLVRRLDAVGRDERWSLGSRDLLRIDDWDLRLLYSMSA